MKKLKYIGNCGLEAPSRHFTIEVEDDNFQNARHSNCHLKGQVIEAGSKSPWPVGYYSETWANPFESMRDTGFPTFILVN